MNAVREGVSCIAGLGLLLDKRAHDLRKCDRNAQRSLNRGMIILGLLKNDEKKPLICLPQARNLDRCNLPPCRIRNKTLKLWFRQVYQIGRASCRERV